MKVDLAVANKALLSLINDYRIILPLDANILIPSDRSKLLGSQAVLEFNFFKKIWLDPLFKTFPYLAIHEAVNEEVIVKPNLKNYIKQKIKEQVLLILKDEDLTENEELLRRSVEKKIAISTKYEPEIDNKDDRGEVKSLAHIYVKELIYFCSNDSNALRLVEHAEKLETNLEALSTLRYYEIIYYLYKLRMAKPKEMRFLYKFHYYSTDYEKKNNPTRDGFKKGMDNLYENAVKESTEKPVPIF